jgi:hypothetical protein
VITSLQGGRGDDSFQVGQIFGEKRNTNDGNLLPQDEFRELVATTRGWLSPGISAPLVAQGGTGNDEFRVYSNQAELRLEGDDDNDLFIIRAFALAALVDVDWDGDGDIDYDDLFANENDVPATGYGDTNLDGNINLLDAQLTPVGSAVDFDWNDDGDIDEYDVWDGVRVLRTLQIVQLGADLSNPGDDLTLNQAIDALSITDFFDGEDTPSAGWKTALKAAITDVDVNNDGSIDTDDVILTPLDLEDDAIFLDDVIVTDEDGVAVPQIGFGFSIAQAPDIRAGGGIDEVRYNVNAPVSVDGGTGFDKLVILGTEFADDIAITKDGIFGAGLNVRYDNIEVVEVDGLEGDDEFFVLSTEFGVAYRVIGGLGSDTINVGGDVTEDIITRELEGVSGAVDHLVGSGDALYDGLVVDGLDYNVTTDGEGLVVIDEGADGFTAVREGGPRQLDSYTVRLARELVMGEVVYVTVSAARSPEEESSDTLVNPAPLPNGEGDTIWLATGLPAMYDLTQTDATTALLRRDFQREVEIKGTTPYTDSLAVEIDGTTHYFASRGVVLTFDHTNWDDLQTVYLYAPDDTRAEGDRVVVVQHSVIAPVSADYDAIDVRNVEVEVRDNDTPGVYVIEIEEGSFVAPDTWVEDGRTLVAEGIEFNGDDTGLSDEILVQLAKDPGGASDEIVVRLDVGAVEVDFDWNADGEITHDDVRAGERILNALGKLVEGGDTVAEAIAALANPGDLNLGGVFADGQPDAAYLAELGGAGITDFDINGDDVINRFDLTITADAADDVTVFSDLAAISDAAIEWDSSDARYDAATRTITFNGDNWDIPVLITLKARDDGIREDPQTAVLTFARDPSTTGQPDYVFPNLRSGPGLLDVEVIDDETAGSIVLESGGDTVLIPDGIDTDS